MRTSILWLTILLFIGCSTYQGVGSDYWHKNRLEEIETAYKNGKLTEQEYLSLKNEVDRTRQEYLLDSAYDRYQTGRIRIHHRW